MIENCAIATMDGPRHDQGGTEYRSGHVTVTGDRITAVGDGPAGSVPDGARRIDGGGCLATPGLVNTHHHLYQWLTQGRAQQSVLFDWLTELYPVWATIDAGQVHAAATAGLAWLALSGCTTSTDHHYIFPREALRGGGDADALAAEVAAAARVGLRFHPCRGSMDLGRSAGGLPPDEIVEDTDAALAATEEAVRRFHDPSPGAMVRVAAAPCSPFSVSPRLMRDSADLASSEGSSLAGELRQALLAARVRDERGPVALTARQALWLGTRGGARCLGRDDETGALRPGMLADIALWRLDGLAHDAIARGPGGDPVAALVLGPPAPLELLLVGGTPVVDGGELRTVDAATAAREVRAARLRLVGPELS